MSDGVIGRVAGHLVTVDRDGSLASTVPSTKAGKPASLRSMLSFMVLHLVKAETAIARRLHLAFLVDTGLLEGNATLQLH